MRRFLPLLALFATQSFAADPASILAGELPSLVELYKELHAHPELSLQEEKTAARFARELRAAGMDVTEHFGGHGVVGILRNGEGPVVMLRTDLDALPVKEQTGLPYASKQVTKDDLGRDVHVMHACGHDIHMSSMVGTVRVLAKTRDQWSGTLLVIGQPAEERVIGARAMLRAGLFTKFPKPDKALALHCASDLAYGTVGITDGYALANVDALEITVRGLGGHGSMPHLSKDPVVLASQIVLALQTIVSREVKPGDPAVVTVGSIHGGTKSNIIPDEVRLQLTLRSYQPETREHLIESVKRIAKAQAEAAGMPKDRMPEVIVSEEKASALYNVPSLASEVRAAVSSVLGSENVLSREPVMGAEDFSEFGTTKDKVPICMYWLGTQPPAAVAEAKAKGTTLPSLHSPLFQPVPEPTIETGVKSMTAAALALFKKK